MSAVRAATVLTVWGAAHRAGAVSPDAVLVALAGTGRTAGARAADAPTAERTGLPGPGEASANQLALLRLFRECGAPRLVMPVAGDVRGLPPKSPVLVPALDAGAAVVIGGLAVVPGDGYWRVFSSAGPATEPEPRGPAALFDVERDLDAAIRSATHRLTTLDVARDAAGVRQQIAQRMRDAAVPLPTPVGRAGRHAAALLAKVISLEALLGVADDHQTAAVSRYELAAVDEALRPLAAAVRAGRLTATAELVADLTDPAGRPAASAERQLATELTD